MKKTFNFDNLDCANCASKMEEGIKKIDGVIDATVTFMTQKLYVEYDETNEKEILKKIRKVVKKVHSDTDIIF